QAAPAVPAAQRDRVVAIRALQRQALQPPVHHPVGFREEAMAADVYPVAVMLDGARDAADIVQRLDDDRLYIRAAQQLHGRREPRRPGADSSGGTLRPPTPPPAASSSPTGRRPPPFHGASSPRPSLFPLATGRCQRRAFLSSPSPFFLPPRPPKGGEGRG